jgi:hypothetical protein
MLNLDSYQTADTLHTLIICGTVLLGIVIVGVFVLLDKWKGRNRG